MPTNDQGSDYCFIGLKIDVIILRYFIYFYSLTVYKISKLEKTVCDITESTFLPKEKYLLLLKCIITGNDSVKYPL